MKPDARLLITVVILAALLAACGETRESSPTTNGTDTPEGAPVEDPQDPANDTMAVEDGAHHHGVIEWDGEYPIIIDLEVIEDTVSGWNLFATVSGFTFAPQRASSDHVAGEGHAHIEVDGAKVSRAYGPSYHLSRLAPGAHVITFALAANDHSVYTVGGEPLAASVEIEADGAVSSHRHDKTLREWDGPTGTKVAIEVVKDSKTGWNLIADIGGFEFTPRAVGSEHVPGQGHAHIYVNGVKRGRVYQRTVHLSDLPAGEVEIEYRLSGNDHVEYDLSGVTTLLVSEEDGTGPAGSAETQGNGMLRISVSGGAPEGGPVEIEAEVGEVIYFVVVADEAEQVHVHGYDLFFDLGPGEPTEIMFNADAPGIFEVELEGSHALIAELTVG